MTIDRMVQMISILANLGVFAGFVFLAIQVQRNSEALEVQSQTPVASAQISAETSFIGEDLADAYAIAIRHPQDLTDSQILSIWGYLSTSMLAVQRTFFDSLEGRASGQEWEFSRTYAAQLLDWPFGRLW